MPLAEPSRDGRRAGSEGAASGALVGGLVAAVVGWGVHALRKDEQRLVLRPTRFDLMTDVAVAEEVAQALHVRPQAARAGGRPAGVMGEP